MTFPRVVPVTSVDILAADREWQFATERRVEIEAHFAKRRDALPGLWNGRVLVLHRYSLDGEHFSGEAAPTDFASFLAWRDWSFPDRAVTNFFAMAALRSTDGAFLLGVMGAHTANAGHVYFPSGTPDPSDLVDGHVDLEGNMWRELNEETGLTVADFVADPGWVAVFAEPRIAFFKVLQAHAPAADVCAQIREHIARQPVSELADVYAARGPDDLHPCMPPFVTAFLRWSWT